MHPAADLLKDCQRLVKDLEKDIRDRSEKDKSISSQYEAARKRGDTGITYGAWLSEQVTQAAVAWVLATVFVRFLEDNRLIDEAWISGQASDDRPQSRLHAATLNREAYIADHPEHSDVQYLIHVVREVGRLPACRELFAEDRNPLFRMSVSADGAKRILNFWRKQDVDGNVIRTLVTDNLADTRWLGDLYQDLSADARERFALLQTPDFVEEFILDYTLTPAIKTFGLQGLRGIDPTCGSGHFLLGMFHHLWHAWELQLGPGKPVKEAVRLAMGSIYGIDLNPFAVAISRFRLMIAGLVACSYRRMKDCPDFGFTLAVGNSLTLGSDSGMGFETTIAGEHQAEVGSFLVPGDYTKAKDVLTKSYHAVVGNPPYKAVKDARERVAIKNRYHSCFKKWSLSAPFTERFFNLAQDSLVNGKAGMRPAGFVGLINSNNFTKREFGKALIERVLPSLDLTHVIDTSGCELKGHETPTVIIFGRNQRPAPSRAIRTVQGIRGEPRPFPVDLSKGKVWTAMVANIGTPGAETPWLSVADVDRKIFEKHPWSLGGGGVGDLKLKIEEGGKAISEILGSVLGILGMTNADDVMLASPLSFVRRGVESDVVRPLILGDDVRDWLTAASEYVCFPYLDTGKLIPIEQRPGLYHWLWASRTSLWGRAVFSGGTYREDGQPWWKWHQLANDRLKPTLTITYGEVATHNHFVLCRGGVVFNRTAPVIKLNAESTEDDHLALLSCLNSSTIAFWMRQRCTCKGGPGGGKTYEDAYLNYFAFNSTNIKRAPISESFRQERIALAKRLDVLGQELGALYPCRLFATTAPTRALLERTANRVSGIRAEMIFLQEELDWLIYRAYGLLADSEFPNYVAGTIPLALGERAFEINLARKIAAGEEETSWFVHHRSTPISEIPAHWTVEYQQVVQRRINLIANHPHIGLLEKPEHKRRWQSEPWEKVIRLGLRNWLCEHLEDRKMWPVATIGQPAQLISTTILTDRAFEDLKFSHVASLYKDNDHFDRHALILELVGDEAVPAQPVLCYTEQGILKRSDWEKVWNLQRLEDEGKTVEIPMPPEYEEDDFQKTSYWNQRGKLDVPKERFICYPGCQPDGDPGMLILWAGYDHAQHATALVAYYQWAKDNAGWSHERLIPLLVSLDQLVPWLRQWHNDLDPTHGQRLGDAYAEFLHGECHDLAKTMKDLRDWRPIAITRTPAAIAVETAKKRGRPKRAQG